MIQYIVILFAFYVITCIYGIPFQIFLENGRMIPYRVITCPIYGFSIGMVCMYYFNLFGFSVTQTVLPLTAFFLAVDIVLIIWKRKDLSVNWKKASLCFLVIASATIYFAYPGVVNNKGGLPILFHNNDFVLYAATSNAVKYYDLSYIKKHFAPLVELIMGIQNRYVGFWIAYISVVFKVNIFNAASLVSIYLYGIFVTAGVGLLSFFCENKMARFVTGLVFFFNCNFQYMFYQGFIGQIASVSMIIVITIIFICILESEQVLMKESISMGIVVVGLLATYGEMIPIVALPMMLILIIFFIVDRGKAKILFTDYLTALLTVAVIFARGYYTAAKTLLVSNQAVVGWDIRPGFLLQSLGIYNVHTIDIFGSCELPEAFVFIFGMVIWAGICIYVYKKFSGKKRLLLETYLLTYGVLYFVFLLHFDLYKTFKAMLTTSYVFIVVLFALLYSQDVVIRRYRWMKHVALVITVFIIVGSGMNIFLWAYAYSDAVTQEYHVFANAIGTEQDEMQEFLEEADFEEIYVSAAPYWDDIAALTMTLGLRSKVQDVEQYIWGTEDSIPDKNTIVIDSSTLPEAVKYCGKTLFKNPVYTVKKVDTSYPFCLNRESLGQAVFYGTDSEGYAIGGRNIEHKDSELNFYVAKDRKCKVHLSFMCNGENKITLIMPDGKEQTQQCMAGKNEMEFSDVVFSKGSHNFIKIKVENTEVYLQDLSFDTEQETKLYVYSIADFDKYSKYMPENIVQRLIKMTKKAELLDEDGLDVSFMPQGNYKKYVPDGLWEGEEQGLWSKDQFHISIRLKKIHNICIQWDGYAFQENYLIHAYCNEYDLGYLKINHDQTLEDFMIPVDALKKGNNQIRIEIENIVSPNQLELGTDGRQLGICLKHINMKFDGY
ncbi:MAG: hypothetical protein K2N87_02500 [Eubacterium sp.]|nr:hypothetical protein [Eubacterium sp.]